ncbi:conserved protein of unknown function [Acidithiobacillus ferrivorans]|uniref:Uncharacterized protein n=1 Tax=Acidithiobacillus ferrivorans TaxID=160808 RepID=A0A060UKJ8_9PROT|nr:hypothetical protein [Acidithiobacillus ferrivorans]CDQ09212.1 conserved hypothetical protein [Acidithiobacillus ferrivorans]SMH64879.1 conserved protein of unknown function [Acidithiobacillus ferrivorans]
MATKIAISIRGGMVQAIYLDGVDDLEAYVLDHDTASASENEMVEIDGEEVICYPCDTIIEPNGEVFRDIAALDIA